MSVNTGSFEGYGRGMHGEDIPVVQPLNNERRKSELEAEGQDTDNLDRVEGTFSTIAENAFFRGRPELTRTEIFIRRFFDRQEYRTIADELNLSIKTTRDLYQDRKLRMEEALQVLDGRRAVINDAEAVLKRSEKRSGKLSKSHKWFLLSKLFGLLPREVASMDGSSSGTVSAMINKVYDRLTTGRDTLLDPTPEEIQSAEARIQRALQKRAEFRERYRERINAARRKPQAA